uniref:Uncharacterized protein n=1 Tax=Ascaris lumbricoides TaxID=6252 RepID=A0A0M3HJE3_ASCLU
MNEQVVQRFIQHIAVLRHLLSAHFGIHFKDPRLYDDVCLLIPTCFPLITIPVLLLFSPSWHS